MSLELVQIFVLVFPPILLAGLALWIRPPWRIIGFALVAGFVMGSLNLLGDIIAFYQGWWHYPFTTANHAPLTFYLAAVIFYGALYNQAQTMIIWGKGFVPVVADFLLWASAGTAGFFTMVGLEKLSGKKRIR
jgi:membrane-bound metal-dependent hydrolase YbcI (DUF457 family)